MLDAIRLVLEVASFLAAVWIVSTSRVNPFEPIKFTITRCRTLLRWTSGFL